MSWSSASIRDRHVRAVFGETTVLNATSAVRREGLARRRADDSEIDRVEMTYVIIETDDGPRIAVMAVHGSEAEEP